MSSATSPVELDMMDLDDILDRGNHAPLTPGDQEKLRLLLVAYQHLTQLIGEPGVTIHSLRRLLGLSVPKSEATKNVCPPPAPDEPPEQPAEPAEPPPAAPSSKPKPPGHGRNGASDYPAAQHVAVAHGVLKAGDKCQCGRGKLYRLKATAALVRITGMAPFQATVYDCEKLRCNACQEVFPADPPPGVGPDKYDAGARSLMAVLKYGAGVPFHRLETLQRNLGVPLPASTQWDEMNRLADDVAPAVRELIRQAAHGHLFHNDDTSMRVLSLAAERNKVEAGRHKRTGIFTTGIVSQVEGHPVALFFTGGQHAGENLADVLARRPADLPVPLQMCDALDRNLPKNLQMVLGNCLAHGRRHFVPLATNFPKECRYVLEQLRVVYLNDAEARQAGMTPAERLAHHQERSGPVMDELRTWIDDQIDNKKVEPNSRLGQALQYMKNHWTPLTLFLREPGAPLDNNICERALKKAILHRKNALFYKTLRGAQVGDAFMSIIHTCELNGVNSVEYLTALQKHADRVACDPSGWLPWNFRHGPEPPPSD